MKFLNTFQPVALVILRVALAIVFLSHGYPKLAHLRGNAQMQSFFVEHGLPAFFLYVAGVLEVFGGALILLGLFTRPAALLLAGEMCVAIVKVHMVHGYLAVHDYEFPMIMAAACLALCTIGPGPLSVDNVAFGGEKGSG